MKLNKHIIAFIDEALDSYEGGSPLALKEGDNSFLDIPFKNDCVLISSAFIDMWINKDEFVKEFEDRISIDDDGEIVIKVTERGSKVKDKMVKTYKVVGD